MSGIPTHHHGASSRHRPPHPIHAPGSVPLPLAGSVPHTRTPPPLRTSPALRTSPSLRPPLYHRYYRPPSSSLSSQGPPHAHSSSPPVPLSMSSAQPLHHPLPPLPKPSGSIPPPLAPPHAPGPLLGWTPRAPHPLQAHTRSHVSPRPPVPSGPSLHTVPGPIPIHNPSKTSPRLKVTSAGVSKPGPKVPVSNPVNSISPPLLPSIPAGNTPSWLKGGYRPHLPPSSSSLNGPAAIEAWCKERIELIKSVIDGKSDSLRDPRKIMQELDVPAISEEINQIVSLRKEFWKARERQRKAEARLSSAEREVFKIDLQMDHIDTKISRLRGYVRFIEGGWSDERVLTAAPPTSSATTPASASASASSTKDPHNKSESVFVKPESVPVKPESVPVKSESVLVGTAKVSPQNRPVHSTSKYKTDKPRQSPIASSKEAR